METTDTIITTAQEYPLPMYVVSIVLTILVVAMVMFFLKKKKMSIVPKEATVGGIKIAFEKEPQKAMEKLPVNRIVFLGEPEFHYLTPIRINDLKIKVYDKDGQGLESRSVTLSSKTPNREEVLNGELTATSDDTGVATFSGLSITQSGTFQIIATCEGKQCASHTFEIPDMEKKAYALIFLEQPKSISGHPAFLGEIRLKVSDVDRVGLPGKKVRLSIFDKRRESELLNGTLEVRSNENGIAHFSGLSISRTGNYQILAVCEDVRCESVEFMVMPPGANTNFSDYEFGTPDYIDALRLYMFMHNNGDTISVDEEKL